MSAFPNAWFTPAATEHTAISRPTNLLPTYTRADIFQRAGEKTPAFVRFSTVAGSKGSFDLARDVRGFAVKLYTQEGNWDLVGNNIPVFFIQDAIKFPDMIHAVKQEPDRAFPQAQSAHDNFWDFISPDAGIDAHDHVGHVGSGDPALLPLHGRLWRPYLPFCQCARTNPPSSSFIWKPKLGLQSVVWNEAVKINGADPDFHRRDLWNAIQSGDFPEWELRPAALRPGVCRQLRLRCARSDQDHPGRDSSRRSRSAGSCSTACPTISSPRPSRSRS